MAATPAPNGFQRRVSFATQLVTNDPPKRSPPSKPTSKARDDSAMKVQAGPPSTLGGRKTPEERSAMGEVDHLLRVYQQWPNVLRPAGGKTHRAFQSVVERAASVSLRPKFLRVLGGQERLGNTFFKKAAQSPDDAVPRTLPRNADSTSIARLPRSLGLTEEEREKALDALALEQSSSRRVVASQKNPKRRPSRTVARASLHRT